MRLCGGGLLGCRLTFDFTDFFSHFPFLGRSEEVEETARPSQGLSPLSGGELSTRVRVLCNVVLLVQSHFSLTVRYFSRACSLLALER